jgi:hypothetical protein
MIVHDRDRDSFDGSVTFIVSLLASDDHVARYPSIEL